MSNTPFSLDNPPPAPKKSKRPIDPLKLWEIEPKVLFRDAEKKVRRTKAAERFNLEAAIRAIDQLHFEETHDGPFTLPDGRKFYL